MYVRQIYSNGRILEICMCVECFHCVGRTAISCGSYGGNLRCCFEKPFEKSRSESIGKVVIEPGTVSLTYIHTYIHTYIP